MQQSSTSCSEDLPGSGKKQTKKLQLKVARSCLHDASVCSSRVGGILGLECEGKGQVPAGSERGQHHQHFTLHLLDSVSCAFPS